MKMIFSLAFSLFCTTTHSLIAQPSENITQDFMNETPYAEIKSAPEKYTSGNAISRSIDGLGYRFYWATEGLTSKVYNYDPGNEGQSAASVIDHILNLSSTILTTLNGEPNMRPIPKSPYKNFEEKRHQTLVNLWEASDLCRTLSDADFETLDIVFKRGEKEFSSPFWHLINGPISDAIYHTGQIVSYRRSAGVPISSKVNVFTGKNRE